MMAITYVFTPNTRIKSSEVNANFNEIASGSAVDNAAIDSDNLDLTHTNSGVSDSTVHSTQSQTAQTLSTATIVLNTASLVMVVASASWAFGYSTSVNQLTYQAVEGELSIATPSGCTALTNQYLYMNACVYVMYYPATIVALFNCPVGTHAFNFTHRCTSDPGSNISYVKYDAIFATNLGAQ